MNCVSSALFDGRVVYGAVVCKMEIKDVFVPFRRMFQIEKGKAVLSRQEKTRETKKASMSSTLIDRSAGLWLWRQINMLLLGASFVPPSFWSREDTAKALPFSSFRPRGIQLKN